jgi:tetratricopeptide (TPR) repeat protein
MKKIIITAILGFLVSLPAAVCAMQYEALISGAQAAYNEGHYEQAITNYESLINYHNIADAKVYNNLALAYYKTGDLARAVVNISRAARLAPRDKDIRYNMQYLKKQTLEPELPFIEAMVNWVVTRLTLNELTALTFIAFLLLCGFTGVYLITQEKKYYKPIITLLIIVGVVGFFFLVKASDEYYSTQAVALVKLDVRQEPAVSSATAFSIAQGRGVSVLSKTGDWALVKLNIEGYTGWIESKYIEII